MSVYSRCQLSISAINVNFFEAQQNQAGIVSTYRHQRLREVEIVTDDEQGIFSTSVLS